MVNADGFAGFSRRQQRIGTRGIQPVPGACSRPAVGHANLAAFFESAGVPLEELSGLGRVPLKRRAGGESTDTDRRLPR
jgi:hypothetical protein